MPTSLLGGPDDDNKPADEEATPAEEPTSESGSDESAGDSDEEAETPANDVTPETRPTEETPEDDAHPTPEKSESAEEDEPKDRTLLTSAPVAANEAFTVLEDEQLVVPAPDILVNDSDADGDALTVTATGIPSHGTLDFAPDGSFAYTTNPAFRGTDTFSYDLSDGNFIEEGNVTINVTDAAANQPPVANAVSAAAPPASAPPSRSTCRNTET
jgi:hypothetical protein